MKARLNATLTALVHDLIPVTHPEYARPGGAEKHARRIETLRREAAFVIANSAATASGLAAHWRGWPAPRVEAAPLGIDTPAPADAARRDRPYFLMVGTIEPRKNHLLLLHIWRQMAQEGPTATIPELLLVGRRGWENEQVVDLLERAPGIRPHVRELGAVPERELAALYRGAQALLMPSFAEGFGLPVAEALSVGTPVLASNIPAHREVAGAAARYLSPIDGEGWMSAIREMASAPRGAPGTNEPAAAWQAPNWDRHLDIVLAAAEKSLP
jgi:glycosyltransferase involved in cell wall biosynthesis